MKAAALAALGLVLGLASVAHAATVSVEGGAIVYAAAPGEANRVVVSIPRGGTSIRFREGASVSLQPGSGCSVAGTQVQCPSSAESMRIELGDGDDMYQGSPFYAEPPPTTVDFGEGDDANFGTQSLTRSSYTLLGGPGDDALVGTNYADRIEGGAGDDSLGGKSGVDVLVGGPGKDLFFARDRKPDRIACDGDDFRGASADDWATAFDEVDRVSGCRRPADPGAFKGCPISTTGARTQRVGRALEVRLWAREDCRVTLTAVVGAGGRRISLPRATVTVEPKQAKRVRLRVPGQARARIRAALAHGEDAAARIKVVARDAAGAKTVDGLRIGFRLGSAS